jgi:Flp pilus assembly protein TadG
MGSRQSLHRNDRGALSVWFAIGLLPMVVAVGAAVDFSRHSAAKAKLASTLDAAALAAAGSPGLTADQTRDIANRYVTANMLTYPGLSNLTVTVESRDASVEVSGRAQLDTMFLGAAGISTLDVVATAEAMREVRGLEVAMVLDNTGSMLGNGGMVAMKDSAKELVNLLSGGEDFHPNLKVALIPFVTAVNIRADGFSMDWIDQAAAATHHGQNFDLTSGARISHLTLFDRLPNADWKGCVEMRAAPHDTSDTPPSIASPDTMFVPYLWPDEPTPGGSNMDYQNNYITNDRVSGTPAQRQRSTVKYSFAANVIDETPPDTMGPNKACGQPLTPLTNDRERLLNDIDTMTGWNTSGTNNAAGIYWGWAVLSPNEPFANPTPYNSRDTRKAMIILTDGENQIWGGWNSHNNSNYSGYGYLALNRLGVTTRDPAKAAIDARVTTLCNNIKATGIRVYTITFAVNAPAIQQVFRNCASEPSLYFHSPGANDLRNAFRAIARDLSQLRLSK